MLWCCAADLDARVPPGRCECCRLSSPGSPRGTGARHASDAADPTGRVLKESEQQVLQEPSPHICRPAPLVGRNLAGCSQALDPSLLLASSACTCEQACKHAQPCAERCQHCCCRPPGISQPASLSGPQPPSLPTNLQGTCTFHCRKPIGKWLGHTSPQAPQLLLSFRKCLDRAQNLPW